MRITREETWKELVGPATDEMVARCIAGTKTWLMRSGGEMAVRRAEMVGDMIVLSGVDVKTGPVAASVPVAELVARAAA